MDKVDKLEIVADNFFNNDVDLDVFIEKMTALIKETYKTGFLRGVERQMSTSNSNKFTTNNNGEIICNQCGHIVNNLNNDPII